MEKDIEYIYNNSINEEMKKSNKEVGILFINGNNKAKNKRKE